MIWRNRRKFNVVLIEYEGMRVGVGIDFDFVLEWESCGVRVGFFLCLDFIFDVLVCWFCWVMFFFNNLFLDFIIWDLLFDNFEFFIFVDVIVMLVNRRFLSVLFWFCFYNDWGKLVFVFFF